MNRGELRKADLNLLVVFETLMQERNVTRAAAKLFLGQPTISAALNRLRDLFNDPLFVRVGSRMQPTARAETIFRNLAPALDAMSLALSMSYDFDPATSKTTFRIGVSEDVEFGLLPPVLRALREEAPNLVFVLRNTNHTLIHELLSTGEITVGLTQTKDLPANAKRKLLRRIGARVLRADAALRPLTLDEYCERPHVVVSPNGSLMGVADEWLAKINRKRNVVLSIPHFSSLPALLANTDMLAGVPDYTARSMLGQFGLVGEAMPFETPSLDLSIVWLSVNDSDPAEQWLRSRLESLMGERLSFGAV